MNRHSNLWIAACILLCPALAQPAALQYQLVHGMNDAKRAAITWGQGLKEKKLEVSTDERFRSEGAASLHLSGLTTERKGNQYLGFKIPVPSRDLEGKRIRFDAWTTAPNATNALYVRCYNAKGEIVGSWLNWSSPFRNASHQTFTLRTGVRRKGFHYEPKVVEGRACNQVVAMEFLIGTRQKNARFDVFIDNVRASVKTVESAAALTKPKKLYLDTALVLAGQPRAVIIAPNEPAHRAAAERVRDMIQKLSRATLPIVDAMPVDELAKTNAILIGNVNTNPALAPLYGFYYTAADAVYPGPGGYVVRTIHDPWGTGANVLLLAASRPDDLGQAVDALAKRLEPGADIVLPPVIEVKFGDDPTGSLGGLKRALKSDYVEQRLKAARRALARGAHGGVTGMVAAAGLAYGRTGRRAYAEEFKKLVYLMFEYYLSKPKTYGGPWGMDADFRLHIMVPAWDLVEESPVFTDADRLKITNIYARFVMTGVEPKARSVLSNVRVRFNHQTFPALGLMYAGVYFKKYYDADEAEQWLAIADACFQIQAQGAKSNEDCNGYQWLTGYHTMKYALARPYPAFFYSGNAQRFADYAILCMDNLGYQVPYGDTGSWQCWWTEMPYLRGAAWFTNDPRYDWALAKKAEARPRININEYARIAAGCEPTDLLGTHAWAMDKRYYDTFTTGRVPRPVAVDKVVMRASFDPAKQYLLLDGLANGGHKHYDGNSICRITDRGRIWIADNDYIKSLPKYHNGVLIFNDGCSATIPPYCELEHFADFDALGFTTTTLRNYAGVNWHRNIIWLKERYFLVLDEMEATEPSDFSFRTVWQLVGETQLTDNRVAVEQKGKRFFIKQAPGPRLKLYDDPALGKNWAGYPYAKPMVHVFQQIAQTRLEKGDNYTFATLLHSADDAEPLEFNVRSRGKGCVAITGSGDALAGIGRAADARQLAPNAAVAAAMFHLQPDAYALVGATRLDWQGLRVAADKPINISARAGQADIVAGEPTRVELFVGAGNAQVHGQVERVERQGERVVLHGLSGRCHVSGIDSTLPGFDAVLQAGGQQVAAKQTAPAQAKTPALKQVWSYREKLTEYLLSNNAGYFEAVDVGMTAACDPAPLAANVFSGVADGTNNLDSLTDGVLRSTQGCVMWDADQPVTLTIDLKAPCQLTRIKLKEWWADSSSKGKTFQLDRAAFEASNDNFANDVRALGEIVDRDKHGNWGAPGYGPIDYELKPAPVEARWLRIRITPKKGTGIYLAELEVWGNKKGLELDLAAQRKRGLPVHSFVALHAADVDRDGKDEIVAGSTNGSVYLMASDGVKRWSFDTGGKVYAVTAAQFTPDAWSIVSGSANAQVHALSAQGKELWTFDIPFYKRTGAVHTIFPADLDGDGKAEIVAGADNWRYYALDAAGKELWHYESVHGSTAGVAADLDGDGKTEVIAGTEYYWWHAIKPDGSRRWSYSSRTGPRANAVAAGNITGDAKLEVLFGGADTNVHALDADGKLLWQYNTGDEVAALAVVDLDGDGLGEVVVGSKSFNVYALKGNGERLWRVDLGDAVADVAVLESKAGPRVAAGTESGRVCVIDAAGKIVAEFDAGAQVLKLVAADIDGDGADEIVVSADDGGLRALKP